MPVSTDDGCPNLNTGVRAIEMTRFLSRISGESETLAEFQFQNSAIIGKYPGNVRETMKPMTEDDLRLRVKVLPLLSRLLRGFLGVFKH